MAVAYTDFRNESGLQLPHALAGSFNGQADPAQAITVTSIALNPTLDAALFEPVAGGK
jgi:hypothetical protein